MDQSQLVAILKKHAPLRGASASLHELVAEEILFLLYEANPRTGECSTVEGVQTVIWAVLLGYGGGNRASQFKDLAVDVFNAFRPRSQEAA